MKKLTLTTVLLSVVLVFSSCTSDDIDTDNITDSNTNTITIITGEEAKDLVENKEGILVDVRTTEEYNMDHIEGATLIPLDTLENSVEETLIDKDANIILYCRSGNRSNTAAKILIDLGYTHVYDMGPRTAWE